MNQVLQFLQNISPLLNTALIISLTGITIGVFQAIVKKKDSELTSVRQQMQTLLAGKDIEISNLKTQIELIEDEHSKIVGYKEQHIQTLQHEAEKYRAEKEIFEGLKNTFLERIEQGVAEREVEIKKKYDEARSEWNAFISQNSNLQNDSKEPLNLTTSEVKGIYKIEGHRPGRRDKKYHGFLIIEENNGILIGQWLFAIDWNAGLSRNHHNGIGLLGGRIMSFGFSWVSENDPQVRAVNTSIVVYEFESRDIINGYWLDTDKKEIGFEKGIRTTEEEIRAEYLSKVSEADKDNAQRLETAES